MTTAFAETESKFRNDLSAARSTPTVTATLINGHARLSAGPFNWDADLPPSIGGGNLAPSPTAYLLGALAGCGVRLDGGSYDLVRLPVDERTVSVWTPKE